MELEIFQVDAFTDAVFAGNPAAVMPLDAWLDDAVLQAIAAENNLSETAFIVRDADAFQLRWFTPEVEVDLCGHATLATAHVLFSLLGYEGQSIAFDTRSGRLVVTRENEVMCLDFPAGSPQPANADAAEAAAIGADPKSVLAGASATSTRVYVYGTQAEVEALTPDFAALGQASRHAVIVTAPGEDHDFVSRFFGPAVGVNEDPVTGSAHCLLVPYWSERLGKTRLRARQVSARGGELDCELVGDRVYLRGTGVTYLRGKVTLAL